MRFSKVGIIESLYEYPFAVVLSPTRTNDVGTVWHRADKTKERPTASLNIDGE